MKVRPSLSLDTERLFQRSSGRLSGQTVVLAVERRSELGAPGWPAPRRAPGVQLTPCPLARREAPRQRFEFSGPRPRPPRTRVRWNEVLGITDFARVCSFKIAIRCRFHRDAGETGMSRCR